jgi:hypothetical protein
MISHQNRWIFVHIQKTGGNSIRQALGVELNDPHKHRFASELREIYGMDAWDSYFKFAFVRNPWDRLVSWWSAIERSRQRSEKGAKLNKFRAYIIANARSFDEFLLCDREIEDGSGSKCIYRNQVDYLAGDMDFIGRFERLETDIVGIAARSGRPNLTLLHLGKSERGPYTDYYTEATAALVAERYSRDIAAFGYRFDTLSSVSPIPFTSLSDTGR